MLIPKVPSPSSFGKELYNPKAFFTHAALLRQGAPHCAKFPTAASRRSLDRVSVPVWRTILSDPLTIVALVGPYPTNQLMVRRLIPRQIPFSPPFQRKRVPSGISPPFGRLSRTEG